MIRAKGTKRALHCVCSAGPADLLPALAWLSLTGLLLSRALLRFTRHPVVYFNVWGLQSTNRRSASVLDYPMLRRPHSGARPTISLGFLGMPVAETDPLPPSSFLPLAAWWNSLGASTGPRLNNSMRRKKDIQPVR